MLSLQYSDGERQNNTWKDWQIRLAEDEFHMWLQKRASVIRNADGSIKHMYAWGLGHSTNMQAEAMALLQGLKHLRDLGIEKVIILGDSQSLIRILVDNTSPRDFQLAIVVTKIRNLVGSFLQVNFFHVLRQNNKEADVEANKAILLPIGTQIRDGVKEWDSIP